MASELRTRVLGLQELERMTDGMRLRSADLRPAWLKIDKRMSSFFRSQFETSGAKGGERWKPLAPETKRQRLRSGGNRGGVDRPLWDFGRLKRSLQAPGPESIRVIKRQLYERGSAVPYAAAHPDRPIIPDPFPGYMLRAFMRVIENEVMGTDEGPTPAVGT